MNDETKRLVRKLSLALTASVLLNSYFAGIICLMTERAMRDAFATVIAKFHQPASAEGGAQ